MNDATCSSDELLNEINDVTKFTNVITNNISVILNKLHGKITELEAENNHLREMLESGKRFKKVEIVKPLFHFDKCGGKITYHTIVKYVEV